MQTDSISNEKKVQRKEINHSDQLDKMAGWSGFLLSISFYFLIISITKNIVSNEIYTIRKYEYSIKTNTYFIVDEKQHSIEINDGSVYDLLISPMHSNNLVGTTKSIKRVGYYYKNDSSICKDFMFICLLGCGDIDPDPGPKQTTATAARPILVKQPSAKDTQPILVKRRTTKNLCSACGKGVTVRSKFLSCSSCDIKCHTRCLYNSNCTNSDFICNQCSLGSLPFVIHDNADSDLHSKSTSINSVNTDPELYKCFTDKGLNFIHLNVRSLLPKLSELKLIASKTKASIIAISESWLDKSILDNELHIPGYYVIRNDRNRNGGGVCVFVKSNLTTNVRKDLMTDDMESIWFEIQQPKSKPIIVGVLYRPPDQHDFCDKFEQVFHKLPTDGECVILGDINICYKRKISVLFKKYSAILKLFNFKQLIKSPTRTTDTVSSIIDHILCNTSEKISQSGVIPCGLSDHDLIFCTRKTVKQTYNCHKTVRIRPLKHYNCDVFKEKLSEVDWNPIFTTDDVNEAWSYFKTKFLLILDSLVPLKEIRIKHSSEEWMTQEILDKMKERDYWLQKHRQERHSNYFEKYKMCRNIVTKLTRNAKQNYMTEQIEKDKGDSKKIWNHLKNLGYENKSKETSSIVLDIDGTRCYDTKTVADHINCLNW